ncbi:(2Fe-2S)-binding protein [Geodermatophilus sp. YIM 151500]|uniref:(2Fe-2S)-binding protein n=1 Tax=Geodermatophilus sp. YIM 151500 TaxID=2984531 RepID=UPI0021E4B911|nr:(2Fe-2S)-binding protein [Geodermatophilus sp. YIM 151500]MCV2491173.1 (2Fe-2S)-binding protein [Geodermatophilus sp. YIM 151500]
MSATAAVALAAAGDLGPFMAVDATPGPDWVSWADVVGEPVVLRDRVRQARELLAPVPGAPVVEPRVAASIVHLGLVARLLSPLLGAALVTGVLPVAAPDRVHLRPTGSHPLPLALPGADAVPVSGADEVAGALGRHWLTPAVEPLDAAVHDRFRLSRKVLSGNVVSAVAGALRTAAGARPELARRAADVLDAVLTDGPLAGTGRRRDDGSFVRRSCCLFYRLPGAGTCADCVLTG